MKAWLIRTMSHGKPIYLGRRSAGPDNPHSLAQVTDPLLALRMSRFTDAEDLRLAVSAIGVWFHESRTESVEHEFMELPSLDLAERPAGKAFAHAEQTHFSIGDHIRKQAAIQGKTVVLASGAVVRVCPDRDIECGRDPQCWCGNCPLRGGDHAYT